MKKGFTPEQIIKKLREADGLYTAKMLVELNKGEIWVTSKPGEGSQFYFTIPLVRSA